MNLPKKRSYAALLRAVNVGGTGKLAMADLKAMCERLNFEHAQTYIASGNVVFRSSSTEMTIIAALEKALQEFMGKPIGVLVRTGPELEAIVAVNPFADAPGNRVVALLLPNQPIQADLAAVKGKKAELLALGQREIYVNYADGIANSRLHIPAASIGTARNMNTIAKLAQLCAAL